MFATIKECFATTKLKPRMIAASGSPQQRLRLAVAKDMARRDKEKEDVKDQPRVRHE